MFVKLVYTTHYPKGESLVQGVSVRDCDEVYFDSATGRLLAITKGKEQTLIDLDTMGPDLSESDQEKKTIMAYIMNDDGKTVDSFELA